MNDVGGPCAGEPHAQFDRGPLATRNQPCGGSWSRAGGAETPPHGLGGTSTAVLRSAEPAAYLTRGSGYWASLPDARTPAEADGRSYCYEPVTHLLETDLFAAGA